MRLTVAGKPDGTVSAERSRTAILTALAAAAALKTQGEWQDFIDEMGLKLGDRDIYRALRLRKRPSGPDALDDPDMREWIWASMEADVAKLGLDLIVAWFPQPGRSNRTGTQAELLAALRKTPGVLSISDCYDDTIVIRALATGPLSKRRLQSRLKELCPEVLWAEVREDDRDQPARGWLHATKVVAEEEERLQAPPKQVPRV